MFYWFEIMLVFQGTCNVYVESRYIQFETCSILLETINIDLESCWVHSLIWVIYFEANQIHYNTCYSLIETCYIHSRSCSIHQSRDILYLIEIMLVFFWGETWYYRYSFQRVLNLFENMSHLSGNMLYIHLGSCWID